MRGPVFPAVGTVEPGVQASQEVGYPTFLGDLKVLISKVFELRDGLLDGNLPSPRRA